MISEASCPTNSCLGLCCLPPTAPTPEGRCTRVWTGCGWGSGEWWTPAPSTSRHAPITARTPGHSVRSTQAAGRLVLETNPCLAKCHYHRESFKTSNFKTGLFPALFCRFGCRKANGAMDCSTTPDGTRICAEEHQVQCGECNEQLYNCAFVSCLILFDL